MPEYIRGAASNVSDIEARHTLPSWERPSRRETEVLRLLAEGKVNKQIAAMLNLSTRTVETYRARLMLKLRVHSVAEIVRYAIRTGLVKP